MKMKPAERNAIQAVVKAAAQEISQLERSLASFEEGKLPHRRVKERLDAAKARHAEAKARLSITTQPN